MQIQNISRIKNTSGQATGWQLRIMRDGKGWSKYYGDKKCGGPYKALEYAIIAREAHKTLFGMLSKR